MSFSAFRRSIKKSGPSEIWIYRYGQSKTRVPATLDVKDGRILIKSTDDKSAIEENFDCKLVWIRILADDSIAQLKNGFILLTPEKEYLLLSNSKKERMATIHLLLSTIAEQILETPNFSESRMSGTVEELLDLVNIREGEYLFSIREDLKEGLYRGEWEDGAPRGRGIVRWTNGDFYEGEFSNGLFHGLGTRRWSNHEHYVSYNGEWMGGEMDSYGEMMYSDGSMYRGWWCKGKHHGYGELICTDQKTHKKSSYFGGWSCGMKQGYGIHDSEESCTRYIGMWSRSEQSGQGVLIKSDGTLLNGTFSQGEIQPSECSQNNPSSQAAVDKWAPLVTCCVSSLEKKRERGIGTVPLSFSKGNALKGSSSKSGNCDNPGVEERNGTCQSPSTHETTPVPEPTSSDSSIEPEFLQSTSHPLGMLLNKWTMYFIAAYSGERGRRKELLPLAVNDVNSIARSLQHIVSEYYPKAIEVAGTNEETSLYRVADYFGTQDHVWLYPVIFPLITQTLTSLYDTASKEKDEEFNHICELLRSSQGGQEEVTEKLGFSTEFKDIQSDHSLDKSLDILKRLSSAATPVRKLLLIKDSYKVLEKACAVFQPTEKPTVAVPTGGVLLCSFCFVLVYSKINNIASQMQFIQDFASAALTFGDIGFAFKMFKDCYHYLLQKDIQ